MTIIAGYRYILCYGPRSDAKSFTRGNVYWMWMIVSGFLESLGINDNKIISGILNFIPSPSKLWYVAKKSREPTFTRIAGFVYNDPCRMLYDNGERAGLGRLVKEITF